MQALRLTATALFIVALPAFLVLTSVRVAALWPRVHEYSFARYDAATVTGVERAELDRAAREIIDYFRNDEELLDIEVTVDGEREALFNEREVLHMRDVKVLMQATFRVHEVAFAILVVYVTASFLLARREALAQLASQLRIAGGLTVALLGVAAVAVLVGFDDLFRQFHVISFANDLWKLSPARDHLIQMYPRGFWFDVTLAVGLLSALAGAALALAGQWYLGYEQRKRRRAPGEPAGEAERAGEGTGG